MWNKLHNVTPAQVRICPHAMITMYWRHITLMTLQMEDNYIKEQLL